MVASGWEELKKVGTTDAVIECNKMPALLLPKSSRILVAQQRHQV